MSLPLLVIDLLPQAAFQDFQSLKFASFTIVCWGVDLFLLILSAVLPATWTSTPFSFPTLGKFSVLISNKPSAPSPLSSCSGTPIIQILFYFLVPLISWILPWWPRSCFSSLFLSFFFSIIFSSKSLTLSPHLSEQFQLPSFFFFNNKWLWKKNKWLWVTLVAHGFKPLCLWFRSWSQGSGIKPHIGLSVQGPPTPAPPTCDLCQVNI